MENQIAFYQQAFGFQLHWRDGASCRWVGMRHFTVELPNQQALDEVIARGDAAGLPSNVTEDGLLVHDPSQNGVVLKVKE